MCSCKILIDLQPKLQSMIQDISDRLLATNPETHAEKLKNLQGTTLLETFGYMLGINDAIDRHQE